MASPGGAVRQDQPRVQCFGERRGFSRSISCGAAPQPSGGLREGWFRRTPACLLDRGLRELDPHLPQLPEDPRRAPQRVRCRHPPDKVSDLPGYPRSARLASSAQPSPVLPETPPLPGDDGLGLDEHEDVTPTGPDPGQPDPEESVCRRQAGRSSAALVHSQLVALSQDLELHRSA